ncbi:hypothetical protein PLICRDRAFT_147192 [Plicaturopsis crispa FD-325 SS-3]|uniref:RecA family profile 1 domain-containing protein n=1 Tax=Plicaturopsis crispa FD-325 SS-3 TaxID=944288 RepID=A0A0C9T8B8_PLICR|nr:hypothetical protein PLICRDRAFT_147192 [Plicaturopsis crispa FD-325 SS-3]
MRLQTLVPHISAELIDALEQCGIRTDAELLFPGNIADIYSRLPHGSTTLSELHNSFAIVAEKAAAPAFRADELLRIGAVDAYDLSSGVHELDQLLGGFGDNRLIEISGDKASGKTALALQIVLRHLSENSDYVAHWIDTTGEFSPQRAVTVLQSLGGNVAESTALERLQVSLAFDIEAAHDVLENLGATLGSPPTVRCIVLDSVTPLLGPALNNVSSQGHATMTTFMRQLRAVAQRFKLTILVINSTAGCAPSNPHSAFSTTTRKPALGPSFTFLTDATLWLAKYPRTPNPDEMDTGEAPTHIAEVFRSKTTRSRTWCSFTIRDSVLSSASPESV